MGDKRFFVILSGLLVSLFIHASAVRAEPGNPVYDTVDGHPLHLTVWRAHADKPGAALVMFHGGAFRHGNPDQFRKLCELFSAEQVTCISVEYSLDGGEQTLEEAKAAVTWVRQNAQALSVDPGKVAVGGSSAGAYLAASTAILNDGQDRASVPNALVLLSALLEPRGAGPSEQLASNIRTPLPPTIILHGTADHLVAIARNERFVLEAKTAGSQKIELIPFPGRDHGAFNYSEKGSNDDFFAAKNYISDFLAKLGWIPRRTSPH
jgi:acetyl esterase